MYPQVPEEGAMDGGREITFHGLNYSWRGQRPPTREIPWGRGGRCRHPRASSFLGWALVGAKPATGPRCTQAEALGK